MRRESERTFVLRFETKNLCSKKNLPEKNEARKAEGENGNTKRAGKEKGFMSLRKGRSEMKGYGRCYCLGYFEKKVGFQKKGS